MDASGRDVPASSGLGVGVLLAAGEEKGETEPAGQVQEEEDYVPAAIARASLQRAQADMLDMKERHVEVVRKIESAYAEIEKQSQQYYVSFVRALQAKSGRQLEVYKSLLRDKDVEAKRLTQQVGSQQEQLRHRAQQFKQTLDAHVREVDRLRRQHQRDNEAQRRIFMADMDALSSRYERDAHDRVECVEVLGSILSTVERIEHEEAKNEAEALRALQEAQGQELDALRTVVATQSQSSSQTKADAATLRREVVEAVLDGVVRTVEVSAGRRQPPARPVSSAAAAAVGPTPEALERLNRVQKRYDALTREASRMEDRVAALQAEEARSSERRRQLKSEIKQWERLFAQENGRAPLPEDKESIRDKYVAYQELQRAVAAAKSSRTEQEARLEERRSAQAAALEECKSLEGGAAPSEAGASGGGPSDALTAELSPGASDADRGVIAALQAAVLDLRGQLQARDAETGAVGEAPAAASESSPGAQSAAADERVRALEAELASAARESDGRLAAARAAHAEEVARLNADHASALATLRPENMPTAAEMTELRASNAALEASGAEQKRILDELSQSNASLSDTIAAKVAEGRSLRTESNKLQRRLGELSAKAGALEEQLADAQASAAEGDASGEVARLQGEVKKLMRDLDQKATATTAGWDAAADMQERMEAEVEAAAAEARREGLADGKKEGVASASAAMKDAEAKMISMKDAVATAMGEVQSAREVEARVRSELLEQQQLVVGLEREIDEERGGWAAKEAALRESLAEAEARAGAAAASARAAAAPSSPSSPRSPRTPRTAENGTPFPERDDPPAPPTAEQVREALAPIARMLDSCIVEGKALWSEGKREECYDLYAAAAAEAVRTMPAAAAAHGDAVARGAELAASMEKAKGAIQLRKVFNDVKDTARGKKEPLLPPTATALGAEGGALGGGGGGDGQRLRALERERRGLQAQVAKLQRELEAVADAGGGSSGGGGGARGGASDDRAVKRQLAMAERKAKKALDDAMKKGKKEADQVGRKAAKLERENGELSEQLRSAAAERDALKKQLRDLGSVSKELTELRERATEADRMQRDLAVVQSEMASLEKQYQEEKTLRRRYWNMMEDMKGKIRVYARFRPMNRQEIERETQQVVSFIDETTLSLETSRGPREFTFDRVFVPGCSQQDIFEECQSLMQSAIDGYNVCCFAYGQTGSGKTFTMTGGGGDDAGLTPRMVHECFRLIEENRGKLECSVNCYFVELYNDKLRDLFFALENSRRAEAPKLDIKLNSRHMVYVKNAIVKPATSAEELLGLFEAGNRKRVVASTNMNQESSRSHSIFSILLESIDRTTGKTIIGKLTIVDLAGSERADKTGATGDRIKEAQAINRSLSALGDVIAALSTGEKFVPYRNNKLTQLMQDSLGGNAKTLMFVNASPSDYNAEETSTSLLYASRVKTITNNAEKQSESAEVARLKALVRRLKAGEDVDEDADEEKQAA